MPCSGGQNTVIGIVPIKDRCAPRFQTIEDFGFSVSNIVNGFEKLKMHRFHRRNNSDKRSHHL